jgi:RHS repeat-associated protein
MLPSKKSSGTVNNGRGHGDEFEKTIQAVSCLDVAIRPRDRPGATARFGYDPLKRLETAVAPMSAAVETCVKYGYLGEGEIRSLGYGASFSNLAVRTFGYAVTNGITRLASRTTPLGKTTDAWTRTFTGLPATHTDGRGVVTSNVWDAAKGLLLRRTVSGSARGLADVTVDYSYDVLDRLTNAVRLVSGTETWRESYSYDSRSRPVRTDTRVQNIPGQGAALAYSVAYTYGPRGMVTDRVLTVGGNTIPTAYTYDAAVPRLASLSDSFASATYSYDASGRLSSKRFLTPNSSLVTATYSSYDAFSRLSSLAVSNQTERLWSAAYVYDVDRLASVTVTSPSAPYSLLTTHYQYDLQGQLTGATGYTPSNTLGVVERFAYDAVGNLTARSLSAPPPPTGAEGGATLAPNADDEAVLYKRHGVTTLIGTVETNAALTLPMMPGIVVEKDSRGNWIAPFVPLPALSGGTANIQLKAEKAGQPPDYRLASFLVNQTSSAMAYDANGALLTLPPGLTLSYDAEGNLSCVSNGTSAVTENWYDDAGRRIAKREGGVLTLYVWEGMDILATANASGTLKEYYTRGPGIAGDVGSLVAEHSFTNGQTVFLHNNHRGDVVLATDSSGAAVGRYEYSAFGMPLSATGTYAPRIGFSSKERDASGLVYYGFRFHSPELCRWITADPIHEDGGLNLYVFCFNNPVNFIDPWGEEAGFGSYDLSALRALVDKARKNCNQGLSPHREIKFAGHMWIRVPEYNEKLEFTGQYFDLHFSPAHTWYGKASDYTVELPVPGITIYHDWKACPSDNRDLLKEWNDKAFQQPEGGRNHYDFIKDNCFSVTIREQLKKRGK